MESIYRTHCPACAATNYVSNGDESDLTREDVEAIRCHACGKVYPIDEGEKPGDDYDPTWVEDGKPSLS